MSKFAKANKTLTLDSDEMLTIVTALRKVGKNALATELRERFLQAPDVTLPKTSKAFRVGKIRT